MKILNLPIKKYNSVQDNQLNRQQHNKYNKYNSFAKNYTTPLIPKKLSSKGVSGEYYRALFDIRPKRNDINFGNLYHKTISSKVPVYEPVCSNYDDIDEFSKQFCEKINSQIQNPSLEDIERLLDNVKKETGADEKLVKEVVFRLSQFSSFNSLKYINKVLKSRNERITEYVPWQCLNSSLDYLAKKFGFFNKGTPFKDETTPVSFIDDYFLNISDKIINSKFSLKEYFSREGTICKTQMREYVGKKSYILDGFDVLTSENKYCGANFMSGTGYLEALSIDIIKQIQNGKDIEDIMHGDLEKKFRKVFSKESIIKNNTHPVEIIKKPIPDVIEAEDILKNLSEQELSTQTVKNTIETYTELYKKDSVFGGVFELQFDDIFDDFLDDKNPILSKEFNKKEKLWDICLNGKTFKLSKKNIQTALMKYLDVFGIVFSSHSMSDILNKKGETINSLEKDTGRKNVYIIPETTKSYSLLMYMYLKNNEIESGRATTKKYFNNDDNFIIIDDVSISGASELASLKSYCTKIANSKNVYYAPVAISKYALNHTKGLGFSNTIDGIVINSMSDVRGFVYDMLNNKNPDDKIKNTPFTYQDMCILYSVLEKNYKNCGTAVAFPYILPDNNSDFASEILSPLLIRSTSQSRKS